MSIERNRNIVPVSQHQIVSRGTASTAIELSPEPITPRRSILQIVWRRRWLVAIAILLCIGAGFLYLAKATPFYRSSSRMLVEQTGPKVIATSDVIATRSRSYLYTQCELLKSTPILSGAVNILDSQEIRTFAEASDPIAILRANLSVSLGKADDIITVTLESPYPEEAADIVNAIVESYVAYQSSQKRDTAAELLKILQKEKDRRDTELKERFEAAMNFKRSNEIISFGTDRSNVILQRLETLSKALTEAELDLTDAKARYQTILSLLSDPQKVRHLKGQLLDRQSVSSSKVTVWEEERNRLQLQLTTLRQQCTENHPAIQNIKLKQAELDKQEEQRLTKLAEAHIGWLKQQVAAAEGRINELGKSMEAQRKLAQELNSKAVEYAMLDAERKRAERICDILDSRIKEIDISEDAGALNIGLLETARVGDAPSRPRRAQTMAIALTLGLLFGTGLAFVSEWLDHRLKSVEEVSEALGLPVLGTVPQLSGHKNRVSMGKIVDLEPTSHAAEAYRTIRTAVYFGAPDIETKTLMITSPAQGDGKSTLISNLAVAMAQAGQKVLVLDADLRAPMQDKLFELEDDSLGVTDVLAGVESLDRAVQHTNIDNLDVLPCGKIPPNPSEILNSLAFGGLLTDLSKKYDRVLVDAPPVLALADARILGARCDATLLVLRAEKSSRKPSQRAVESLLSVGSRILGVVVNRVASRGGGYGYHEYGYYGYGYGHAGRQLESSTIEPDPVEAKAS